MGDELVVQPADQVETIHSSLKGHLKLVRTLLGRPDFTANKWTGSKARTWCPTHLVVQWAHHAGGPGSAVERGPWVLDGVDMITSLRLKSGSLSESVDETWDINYRFDWKFPLFTTMGASDYPVPGYVVPLLDSMLPFDWDAERDGVPTWRR